LVPTGSFVGDRVDEGTDVVVDK
uniref:Uncharacterized protein n=1 Tax=Amphimedon queenslandica TaxID=400682 RepID=A0A1X7VC04_AMPQE